MLNKAKSFLVFSAAGLLIGGPLFISKAEAINGLGTARQVVIAALSITNVSDLDFGTAPQGSPAKAVAPGNSENSENGSFRINGAPNMAYTITLPADNTVSVVTGAGGTPDTTIAINQFQSFPAAGSNGVLDGSGQQMLFVGATRAAISATQAVGTYTGTYVVDVVY